ncbi:hypothetical protein ScPMuIL_007476 [Solemya velum]
MFAEIKGIYLKGGPDSNSGRVEILYNDTWGTICDEGWDNKDALVVCRMLGKSGIEVPVGGAYFGEGPGDVLLTEVDCGGYELDLAHCLHSGWRNTACNHSRDAGVMCGEAELSLKGGIGPWEGRVEMKLNGISGTVCNNSWDSMASSLSVERLDTHLCSCPCGEMLVYEPVDVKNITQRVMELKKELALPKGKLSSTVRAKTSAGDQRPSAAGAGALAIVIIVSVIVGIVVPDSIVLFNYIRKLIHQRL